MPSITLQAEKKNFDTLVAFVDAQAKEIGFTGSALYNINLAAEEAIINVIKYAYPQITEHLTVLCEELAGPQRGLTLKIRDRGIPFDPLAQTAPDPKQEIEKRPIGGLGVYMIKKTANHVSYKRENNSNILTIIFYLPEKK